MLVRCVHFATAKSVFTRCGNLKHIMSLRTKCGNLNRLIAVPCVKGVAALLTEGLLLKCHSEDVDVRGNLLQYVTVNYICRKKTAVAVEGV